MRGRAYLWLITVATLGGVLAGCGGGDGGYGTPTQKAPKRRVAETARIATFCCGDSFAEGGDGVGALTESDGRLLGRPAYGA